MAPILTGLCAKPGAAITPAMAKAPNSVRTFLKPVSNAPRHLRVGLGVPALITFCNWASTIADADRTELRVTMFFSLCRVFSRTGLSKHVHKSPQRLARDSCRSSEKQGAF